MSVYSERAMEIARDAVFHLKDHYPATYNTKPKTAMLSLRGYIHNAVEMALLQVEAETVEKAARVAETIYGSKSVKCSENSFLYRTQDDTCDKIAKAIRQMNKGEK